MTYDPNHSPALDWWRRKRPEPTLRDGRGPERVETDKPDPDFQRRPVGFRPPEQEPLTWDGDGA